MTGEPSYLELGVADAGRALAFYGAVLGWTVDPAAGGCDLLKRVPALPGFGAEGRRRSHDLSLAHHGSWRAER